MSGLTAVTLLTTGIAGTAHADDQAPQGEAAPIPVAITGPEKVDLSLQGEPSRGEPQIELRLRGPGEPEVADDGHVIPVHQGKYTVTIDATGLRGVADVKLPCKASGLVAVCTEYDLYGGDVYNPKWGVRLDINDESEAGDLGTLVVTGEGEGLEFTEHRVDVLVGGPEFRMRELTEPKGFAAGDTYQAPLGFRNAGSMAADGVVLRYVASRGLSFPEEYSNCEYTVEGEKDLLRERKVALCTIEGTFEAGAAYQVSEPVKVKTAGFALHDIFYYRFTALSAEEAGQLRASGDYRAGSGRKLTLKRVENARAGDYAQYAELDLPTKNTYDLDLVGDRAHGKQGETVTVDFALHNHGPAWISSLRAGGEPIGFLVDIPEGATAVKTPRGCGVSGEAARQYLCWAGTPLLEKDKREFSLELRIDKVVEGAKGRIHMPKWENPWEGNPANDDGWIVLNGTGDEETPGDGDGETSGGGDNGGSGDSEGPGDDRDGDGKGGEGGGGSTGGGSTGGDGAGGGDTDGGLALTGTSALTLAGTGLALLLAGAAAVVVVRRRRAAGAGGTGGAAA